METIAITVTKVEKRDSNFGITNFKAPKYVRVHHTTNGYCLYVEGVTEDGKKIHFFTPQAEITNCDGMMHWSKLTKNTGNFFKEIKGELIGHNSPFKGDTIMPICIEDTTEILPSITIGDSVAISYKSEEQKYGQLRLKTVRLIN